MYSIQNAANHSWRKSDSIQENNETSQAEKVFRFDYHFEKLFKNSSEETNEGQEKETMIKR